MPRVDKVTERRMCMDDALLDSSVDEPLRQELGLLSPSHKFLPSTETTTIRRLTAGKSLEEKESILKHEVEVRQTWKYVLYNELAKVQYAIYQKFADAADDVNGRIYARKCLGSIEEAKDYVDSNRGTGNLDLKSIVYYNYSQFKYALNLGDKTAQAEALSAINKAMDIHSAPTPDYRQDCLIHKSFVLRANDQKEEAKSVYEAAFDINPQRFVSEYTTDGSGREMIFFLISNDMENMLAKVAMEKDSFPYLQLNDRDNWTPLHFAMQHKSTEATIQRLLELGVDPLFKPDNEDYNALIFAFTEGWWDTAQQMLDFLEKHNRSQNINMPEIIAEVAKSDNSDECIAGLILMLEGYGVPHTEIDTPSDLTQDMAALGLPAQEDPDSSGE